MIKDKKIVIIEDIYIHFEIYHSLVEENNKLIYPALNPTENQLFIAQVKAYILTTDVKKRLIKQGKIQELFVKKLGDKPDVFIIDWNLYEKDGDMSGKDFKEIFIDKLYPEAQVIQISQFIVENKISKDKKSVEFKKYGNGSSKEQIKNYLTEQFSNL